MPIYSFILNRFLARYCQQFWNNESVAINFECQPTSWLDIKIV